MMTLFIYVALCFLVGYWSDRRGRSFAIMVFASLVLTPLLGAALVLLNGRDGKKSDIKSDGDGSGQGHIEAALIIPPAEDDEENCTPKQADFINYLISILDLPYDFDPLEDLSKWQASAVIDQLLDMKRNGPDGEAPERDRVIARMMRDLD